MLNRTRDFMRECIANGQVQWSGDRLVWCNIPAHYKGGRASGKARINFSLIDYRNFLGLIKEGLANMRLELL